jgi:hypothetical protein
MKLQEKIYINENPLSFEKLISNNRMQIFSTMQEYLNSKKSDQGKIIPNESCRELFITNHESLRLGVAPQLLQTLNMHKQMS